MADAAFIRGAVEQLRMLLLQHQYRFKDEVELHVAIADVLTYAGIPFERERPITARDRLDFYLPLSRIGIEVKVAGAMQPALRQVGRYLEHADVDGMVLAASRSWARGGYRADAFSSANPKVLALAFLARPI